jgi:uncharacterized BrkB/YihY/UPF0761 family membrane protein
MELEADDKVPQDDKIQVGYLTRLIPSGEYVKNVYNTLPQTKQALPWLSDDDKEGMLGKPIPPLNLVTQVESGKGATGGNTVVLLELLMVSLGLLIVAAVIVRAYRIKTPESKGYVRKEVFLSAVVGLVTGVFYILIILSTLGILRSSSSSSRLRLTKRLGRLGRVGEEFMVGYIQYHRVYLGLWLFVLSAMGVSIDSVVVSVVVSSIGLVVGVVYLLWITVRFLKRKKKNSP